MGLFSLNIEGVYIQTQVFSSEFFEISRNTLSYKTPPVAASIKRLFDEFLRYDVTRNYVRTAFILILYHCSLNTNILK